MGKLERLIESIPPAEIARIRGRDQKNSTRDKKTLLEHVQEIEKVIESWEKGGNCRAMKIDDVRQRLREIREQAGLSQQEISERLGVSFPVSAIRKIEEGGRNIGISTIEKWCEACGTNWVIDFQKKEFQHLMS